MRRHMPEEVARFFAPIADASSAWARLRSTPDAEGELLHMADGEGERFRDDTRAGFYRCVLPPCDGLLTVAAGNKNRHHWRHRSAPSVEHSPETLWHITAKAALAAFAREQQPGASVLQDERYTDSHNKPDVWVRWKDDTEIAGDIAFEAQFSALDPRELDRRHDRYATDTIVPVWLFAHLATPEIIRQELHPDRPVVVRLRREHQAASAGAPLRWLNPDQRTIATAYVTSVARHYDPPDLRRVRQARVTDKDVSIAIDSLDDCTLDERGMHTPTDRWIAEESERVAAVDRAAEEEFERRRSARPSPTPNDDIRPNPTPPAKPQPPRNPLEHACQCGGDMVLRESWPDWYRPPATVTALIECARCGDLHGTVRSDLGPVDYPRGHVLR